MRNYICRAPVVASCPCSALGCACDEEVEDTQEDQPATPQLLSEGLLVSEVTSSALPRLAVVVHVSDQVSRWHAKSDCFGLKKATRTRTLTPCQICARNFSSVPHYAR